MNKRTKEKAAYKKVTKFVAADGAEFNSEPEVQAHIATMKLRERLKLQFEDVDEPGALVNGWNLSMLYCNDRGDLVLSVEELASFLSTNMKKIQLEFAVTRL